MAESTRYEITVVSKATYVEDQSDPSKNQYVFAYTITISNTGTVPAQLVSRHWVITDANGKVIEVKGLGVVGQQPLLKPGESSGCCPTTPRPLTSITFPFASVMTQCRLTSCAGTVPVLLIVIV